MTRLMTAMMAALVLAGCGQTGPLYMPDNEAARERYDPQGDYQPDEAQPNDAQQNDSRQSDAAERTSQSTSDGVSTGGAGSESRDGAVSVPEGDSRPATTTGGQVGGAASTGAPAATPTGAGQGGT
ncbi:LPS translocon maturation chaperone LptM [Kushneria sp. EE4]